MLVRTKTRVLDKRTKAKEEMWRIRIRDQRDMTVALSGPSGRVTGFSTSLVLILSESLRDPVSK